MQHPASQGPADAGKQIIFASTARARGSLPDGALGIARRLPATFTANPTSEYHTMSMIKTENGWRQLSPLFTTNKLPREEPVRYRGQLPSQECIRYIWSLEIAHQEWVERRRELGLTDETTAPKSPVPKKGAR